MVYREDEAVALAFGRILALASPHWGSSRRDAPRPIGFPDRHSDGHGLLREDIRRRGRRRAAYVRPTPVERSRCYNELRPRGAQHIGS